MSPYACFVTTNAAASKRTDSLLGVLWARRMGEGGSEGQMLCRVGVKFSQRPEAARLPTHLPSALAVVGLGHGCASRPVTCLTCFCASSDGMQVASTDLSPMYYVLGKSTVENPASVRFGDRQREVWCIR